jgi:hypothetical protein
MMTVIFVFIKSILVKYLVRVDFSGSAGARFPPPRHQPLSPYSRSVNSGREMTLLTNARDRLRWGAVSSIFNYFCFKDIVFRVHVLFKFKEFVAQS